MYYRKNKAAINRNRLFNQRAYRAQPEKHKGIFDIAPLH
jgi:hypothetical protein